MQMGLLLTTIFKIYVQRTRCQMLMLIALWCMKLATIRKHFEQYLHKWLSYIYYHFISWNLGLGIWDAKEIKPPFISIQHSFYIHSSANPNYKSNIIGHTVFIWTVSAINLLTSCCALPFRKSHITHHH